MKDKGVEVRHQIHVYNGEIAKKEVKLLKIEDYAKALQAIVPMVELATRFSSRADLDEGHDKEALRIIMADILTIKNEVAEAYSDTADSIKELSFKVEKLKKEV